MSQSLNTMELPVFTQLAGVMWQKAKDQVPRNVYNSGLFQVMQMPANSGNVRQLTEIDHSMFARYKGEMDQSQIASFGQGYTKNVTAVTFTLDAIVSHEDRRYNKYPEVTARLTNLGAVAYNKMEIDLTHRFTFGDATAYTDMDGRSVDVTTGDTLALFSGPQLIQTL